MTAPVLFVTGKAPPDRIGAFAELAAREEVEFALYGGRGRHATGEAAELPFPHRRVSQREAGELAGSGRFRAVICGTGGRVALPGAYRGARRAGVPFILWASLWAHPRGPAGLAGYLPLRHVYRSADAIATYGPHVTDYVRRLGVTAPVVEAPQAVDNAFWGAAATPPPRPAPFVALCVGRLDREKGIRVLAAAWRQLGAAPGAAALLTVGDGPERAQAIAAGAIAPGMLAPEELRNLYAGADVLVVPSITTATFREPWGLVVNEAMNQGLPVIATTAVGAAAGGLVRHERTGLIVGERDPSGLAAALRRLQRDPGLRARLGAAARAEVARFTQTAWAGGMAAALAATRAAKGA